MRGPALLVIAIATCMSYARVLIEISIVSPRLFRAAVLPVGPMALVSIVGAAGVYLLGLRNGNNLPEQENPTQLRSALIFAAVFALVLLGVEAARRNLGENGMYAASAIAGLVNLDAITLTNSRIAQQDAAAVPQAWRAIIVALMANLVFKTAAVAALGGRALVVRLLAIFVPQAAAGAAILLYWP
jgi:uncharacterized membrane protein (DUF4010 family)